MSLFNIFEMNFSSINGDIFSSWWFYFCTISWSLFHSNATALTARRPVTPCCPIYHRFNLKIDKSLSSSHTLSTKFQAPYSLAPWLTTFFLITFLFFCENPDACPIPIIAIRMEAFSISLSVTAITWLTAIWPIWPFCPWRTNRKWTRLDICPNGMIVFADRWFEKIFLNSFPSMKFLMYHWIRTTMLNSRINNSPA